MEFNIKRTREFSIEFYETKDGRERGQLRCPVCGKRSWVRVHRDTVIENMPLICLNKCHNLSIVSYRDGKQVLSE